MASDMPGPEAGPQQPEPEAQRPAPTPPAGPAVPGWTAPPPPNTSAGGPIPGWGAAPAAPQQPSQPGPQPAPQPSPQPGWGATAQEPQQQPSQPQAPAWNSPAQPPVPQPGWATPPPPQGPAPQPGWGAPGQPQPGYVYGAPPPAKTGGNGCLKACLIVGAILVVLAIVVVIALGALGASFFGGLGIDSSGNLKDCPIVSSAQLKSALGPDTEAHPLSGLANAAVGLTLDKRVLKDADNCYIVSGASSDSTQVSGGYGRIAKYSGGDAASVFDRERSSAQAGKYFAQDVSGAGDQAFCTGWSDTYPATGALVRRGNDLVYVSLLVGSSYGDIFLDQASSAAGVPYSPKACSEAVSIAELAFH